VDGKFAVRRARLFHRGCGEVRDDAAGLVARQSSRTTGDAAGHGLFPDGADKIDRKSTRLNSSHVAISYAVFCLKKKKKKKTTKKEKERQERPKTGRQYTRRGFQRNCIVKDRTHRIRKQYR